MQAHHMHKRPLTRGTTPRSARPTQAKAINGYVFNGVLGKGQYGTVYKAMTSSSHEVCAVKVIAKSKVIDSNHEQSLQREIDVLAFLNHPNVARLLDFFEDAENYYLVMDLCPGGELQEYIKKNGKVKEETAALLFYQIVSAIDYCHASGIVHRDIKPANVMIEKFPVVKVTDFGLCAVIQSEPLTDSCGSPSFCSPECLFAAPHDGVKSDIWSLGVTLYAMVTGNLPWNCSDKATMLSQILQGRFVEPNVSESCRDLIASMLKVNPSERPSLETVLRHPWFKLADKATAMSRPQTRIDLRKSVLYRQKGRTVGIMEILERQKKADKKGIQSPFEGDVTPGQVLRKNTSHTTFSSTQRVAARKA